MQRFFSIAILLNWLGAIAFIGVVGLGLGETPQGLMRASALMLSGEINLVVAHIAESISIAGALSIVTAGLWAILALVFADPNGSESADQEFVVNAAMGFCLFIFAMLLCLAVWSGNHQVGALASVASLVTVLAAIAHHISAVETSTNRITERQHKQAMSLARATSMANQSASLAAAGSRSSRFVPKRPYKPQQRPA